ncbi:MAG: hypothetical protein ACI9CA_002482 [Natronomonas sp.]|jgi:hypothetical protein
MKQRPDVFPARKQTMTDRSQAREGARMTAPSESTQDGERATDHLEELADG